MLENPWSAVGNPTSALGTSGLAPLGIHHLLLGNLTTEHNVEIRYANMRLPHISIAALFVYFSEVRISHIFQQKLAFSMAILIFFVFLLPISI